MSTCCEDQQNDVEQQDVVVDYTDDFNRTYGANALLAQGQNTNFLALTRLDTPVDGAHFELSYRWLSQPCTRSTDQAYCCVRGSEVSYWKIPEMIDGKKLMRDIKSGKANLFDHFNLF